MKQSHPRNDRQYQELSSPPGLTTYCQSNTGSCTGNPQKFDKTTTPDDIHNMQRVPRVQAPPSNHIPHIKTKDKSCTPCTCRHQFQGCLLIFLKSNPSAHPLLQPSLNLEANPPHWPPSCPDAYAIVSGKQNDCAMLLLQPAQPHT
jgi:hypothetical protein